MCFVSQDTKTVNNEVLKSYCLKYICVELSKMVYLFMFDLNATKTRIRNTSVTFTFIM